MCPQGGSTVHIEFRFLLRIYLLSRAYLYARVEGDSPLYVHFLPDDYDYGKDLRGRLKTPTCTEQDQLPTAGIENALA